MTGSGIGIIVIVIILVPILFQVIIHNIEEKKRFIEIRDCLKAIKDKLKSVEGK